MINPAKQRAFTRAVGQALRDERKWQNRTQESLAKELGIWPEVLTRAETNPADVDTYRLALLCSALDVRPSVIISRAEQVAFPLGWPYWSIET